LRVRQRDDREGEPLVSAAVVRATVVSVPTGVVSVRGDGIALVTRMSSIVGVSRIDARIGPAVAGPEPGVVVAAIQDVAPCPGEQEQDRAKTGQMFG
jgi:hypothetical protein